MICPSSDTLISLNQVPSHLENLTGKRPHLASIYRWLKTGIAGVRLESLIIGGTRVTSIEALERFFQASTEAKDKQLSKPLANVRRNTIEAQAKKFGI